MSLNFLEAKEQIILKHLLIAQVIVALSIAGCSTSSTLPNPAQIKGKPVEVSPYPEVTPDTLVPFSYKVTPYMVATAGRQEVEGESSALLNDRPFRFKRDQIAIALRKEEDLDKILRHLNARVVDQETIPVGLKTTGSKEDGTARQLPVEKIKKLPRYLLEVPVSDDDDLRGFEARAKEHKMHGAFVFKSKRDASLLNKSLELKERFPEEVLVTSLNTALEVAAQTTEGLDTSVPYLPNQLSPYDEGFYFAGHFNTTRGANINEYGADSRARIAPNMPSSDGTGVVVAVIDGGFQAWNEPFMPPAIMSKMEMHWNTATDHPEIAGHQGSGVPWHGRAVSSLIFAKNNDNMGTMGCAPDAQPLLIHTSQYEWDFAEAIDTARDNGARVINMSYSTTYLFTSWIYQAVQAADAARIIMVASTGNDGNQTTYPAAYPAVMGVAASNWSGQNAGAPDPGWQPGQSSNTTNADLWAPGTAIATAVDPGQVSTDAPGESEWGVWVTRRSGTSFAAPLVTGAIAACAEKGYMTSADTLWAIQFMRTYSTVYNNRRNLNVIYAVE